MGALRKVLGRFQDTHLVTTTICTTYHIYSMLSARRYSLASYTPHCECGVIAPTDVDGIVPSALLWILLVCVFCYPSAVQHVQNGHPHRRCFNPTHQDESLMCGVGCNKRNASRGDALKYVYLVTRREMGQSSMGAMRRRAATRASMSWRVV